MSYLSRFAVIVSKYDGPYKFSSGTETKRIVPDR